MENHIKMTPKDFFMHLLGFLALYASIISFIVLFFQYINVFFPDKLNFYFTAVINIIHQASAALLVVFAVFLLITWLIEKDFAKNPDKRDLKFRKWLIYFTLFASAVTIIVDLIRLVYDFLSGGLTTSFFLKVMVVLLVAAGVFSYYFWDLRRKIDKKYNLPKIIALISIIIVLGGITVGFFIGGSPAVQRQRKADDIRVGHLQEIQTQIVNYWQLKEKLPTALTDLTDSISGFKPLVDPETNSAYEYTITSPLAFELCATFNTISLNNSSNTVGNPMLSQPANYYGNDPYSENWSHSAGRVCFSRTIDSQLYKLDPNVKVIK